MVLDFGVLPTRRQANASRMKYVFSDSQFWENNIILRNVANNFLISRNLLVQTLRSREKGCVLFNIASHTIDFGDTSGVGCLAHENVDKSSCTELAWTPRASM